MYWKLSTQESGKAPEGAQEHGAGRFVLHRHTDERGPHLDLRLEQEGYLTGFRVDALALDGETWAEDKLPHSIDWLERDGEAIRADSGTYSIERSSQDQLTLHLVGEHNLRTVHAVRNPGLGANATREVCAVLREYNVPIELAARCIADGITARRRAIERLCGLARELDAAAFDEAICRRSLVPLSLEEIHVQLRAYEARFDAKYPPLPVSRPEVLQTTTRATDKAIAIVRDGGARIKSS